MTAEGTAMSDADMDPRVSRPEVDAAAERAAQAIPPAWPLASNVAVNPYLGQAGEGLAAAGARLRRVAGMPVVMPRRWYQDRIAAGTITDADLSGALASAPPTVPPILGPASLAALKSAAAAATPAIRAVPTVADLAAEASGIDWPGLIDERLGTWAAGYFDEGQALWAAPRGRGAFAAWRAVATHDLTPEIAGLAGFATTVSNGPEHPAEARARAACRLGLPVEAVDTYFHQLLTTLGGWAQYARYQLWQAELAGRTDATATDLLTIRLVWEEALFDRYAGEIGAAWTAAVTLHAAPVTPSADDVVDAVLQEAAERASQRALAGLLAEAGPGPGPAQPRAAGRVLHRRAVRGVPAGVGGCRTRDPDAGVRRLLRRDGRAPAVRLRRAGAPVAGSVEPRAPDLRRRPRNGRGRPPASARGPGHPGLGPVQAGRRVVVRLRRGGWTDPCDEAAAGRARAGHGRTRARSRAPHRPCT